MYRLTVDQLKFPAKLRIIIADEGSYEDDSFSPLMVTVSELAHKGKVVIGYQLSFEAGEHFEEIEDMMYEAGMKINGDSWEQLLRRQLKSKDPAFEKLVNGDTESENCVLWTEKEEHFRRLLSEVLAFLGDPKAAGSLMRSP